MYFIVFMYLINSLIKFHSVKLKVIDKVGLQS